MKKLIPFILLLSIGFVAHSQTVDNTFSPKLLRFGIIRSAIPVADNKIVIAGSSVLRLNANGTIDETFNPGLGADGDVSKVLQTADGKLLVFGAFKFFNGTAAIGVVRLNTNGSVDAGFNSALTTREKVSTATLQSTGKIIVASGVNIGSSDTYAIKRLNTDGSVDDSFHFVVTDNGAREVTFLNTLANDKILVSGYFENYDNKEGANQMVRLNADGTFDNTFDANITYGFASYIRTMALVPGGKILTYTSEGVKRLNEDGSVDGTFTTVATPNGYPSLAALDDGTFFMASGNEVAKYTALGGFVTTVTVGNTFSSFTIGDIFNIGNGRLLVQDRLQAPYSTHSIRNATNLTLADGTTPILLLRNGFDFYLDGTKPEVTQQPDGKFLITSYADFYTTGDVSVNKLYKKPNVFRLNSDFTVDETFDYSASSSIVSTNVMHVANDGKIYASRTNSNYVTSLERLNSNGSVDGTFSAVTSTFADITQLNANTLAGITWNSNEQRGHIVKFNTSGVVDNTFDVTSVGQMRTIDASSDGKMYLYLEPFIVADGLKINGTIVKPIVKLKTDGTLDNPFDIGAFNIRYVFNNNVVNDELITAGSSFSNSGDFPVQRWSDLGLSKFSVEPSFAGHYGSDFLVDGSKIYMLIKRVGEYSLVRTDLNGVLDKSFKKLTYYKSPLSSDNLSFPDRIYKLADGSFLIRGFQFYRVTLPANVPTNPTNLTAESKTSTSVTLNWVHPSSDATVFEVERASGPGTFAVIATVDGSIITYTDNEVEDGKTYSYRVRAVNAAGYSAYTATAITEVITGIEDSFAGLKVYPNPVKDQLHIQSGEIVYRYTVFQLDGRAVESAAPNSEQFTINVNNYAAGLYLLKLEQSGEKKVLKIFKQ